MLEPDYCTYEGWDFCSDAVVPHCDSLSCWQRRRFLFCVCAWRVRKCVRKFPSKKYLSNPLMLLYILLHSECVFRHGRSLTLAFPSRLPACACISRTFAILWLSLLVDTVFQPTTMKRSNRLNDQHAPSNQPIGVCGLFCSFLRTVLYPTVLTSLFDRAGAAGTNQPTKLAYF